MKKYKLKKRKVYTFKELLPSIAFIFFIIFILTGIIKSINWNLEQDIKIKENQRKILYNELNDVKKDNYELNVKLDELIKENQEIRTDDEEKLSYKEKMFKAIKEASEEFDVPEGLILGIAKAESSMGENFYNEYDKDNCHNWWGLKGGNTNKRIETEDSYLRCFNNEISGARTVAKTLRNYYLDEGKDTPEKIAYKWIGSEHCSTHCKNWINNVKKYYK